VRKNWEAQGKVVVVVRVGEGGGGGGGAHGVIEDEVDSGCDADVARALEGNDAAERE
jgi:hypothetical protein